MSTARMMEGGRKVGKREEGKKEGREGGMRSLLCGNDNPTALLSCPEIKANIPPSSGPEKPINPAKRDFFIPVNYFCSHLLVI